MSTDIGSFQLTTSDGITHNYNVDVDNINDLIKQNILPGAYLLQVLKETVRDLEVEGLTVTSINVEHHEYEG